MTIELRAADGGAVQVSPEILQAFKAGFRGPVLGPDAADYEETRETQLHGLAAVGANDFLAAKPQTAQTWMACPNERSAASWNASLSVGCW